MSEKRLIFASSNLILVVCTVLLLFLLWQLRSLIIILMIAVVIASTLAPTIERVEKFHLPRWLAVILVYLGLIALLTGSGLIIGPTIILQIEGLLQKLPLYLDKLELITQEIVIHFGITEPQALEIINKFFDLQALVSWAFSSSQQLIVQSLGLTKGFLGVVFNLILALVLSGYMLSGSTKLIKGIVSLFPQPWDQRLEAQVMPVSQRMGGYIQGRIFVSGILGIVITIGLKIVGIDLALGLGFIAGFTNLIPFFGPVLGSILPLIVAIAQDGWTFLWVLLLFVIIQNLESYVLDPLLVGSSVKVSPLYQLLAVLGGTQVLGIIGALIVPPWVAGMTVMLENLYLKPKLITEKINKD